MTKIHYDGMANLNIEGDIYEPTWLYCGSYMGNSECIITNDETKVTCKKCKKILSNINLNQK